MKKTLSIFLVFSFIFNATGYLLIFSLLQIQLKEIAKKNFYANKLENKIITFSFSKTGLNKDLHALRFFDENEFSYRGKMYDVVAKKCANDSIYFYCVPDIDEDELNQVFNKSFDSDEKDNKNSPTQNLLQNILQDCILSNNPPLPPHFKKTVYYTNNSIPALFNIYEVTTPPPVSLLT